VILDVLQATLGFLVPFFLVPQNQLGDLQGNKTSSDKGICEDIALLLLMEEILHHLGRKKPRK